jgi:hypothetical protein
MAQYKPIFDINYTATGRVQGSCASLILPSTVIYTNGSSCPMPELDIERRGLDIAMSMG